MDNEFHITGHARTGEVSINGKLVPLERSLKLRNHSPTGFAWGYSGSGPSQLALALLLEMGLKEKEALEIYQEFKHQYISSWPRGELDVVLSLDDVLKKCRNKYI